tara:strand:- start:2602 stop:2991 length:390 start_codon:yes stop_codon:yes gene_type:complete
MACFWEGIRASLSKDDKLKLGITDNTIPNLIMTLKNNNTLDISVLWQNKALTKKEQVENYTHIKDYNIGSYGNGYLCSTCDPFLILLSNTLNVNIKHEYLGNIILYSIESDNTYIFKSNQGHFTYHTKM